MTTFILFWYQHGARVEQIEASKVDKGWAELVAQRYLDVVKIKYGKPHMLDMHGSWLPVPVAESANKYARQS